MSLRLMEHEIENSLSLTSVDVGSGECATKECAGTLHERRL